MRLFVKRSVYVLFAFICTMFFCSAVSAENCYLKKDGFAVYQPYMVTKSCFLFSHAANVDLRHQSDLVITRKEVLHPDPVHAEFLRYVLDRKLMKLPKGTPVFSCNYELEVVARDFKLSGNTAGVTRTRGYELPQYHCNGTLMSWVQVRPLDENHCFWIAVPLLECKEFGKEIAPISVTDPLFYEEEE
ncbi:MAG: hypothetical protein D6B25_16420 [Desulfobulbaceae bacterium]|nr:MAG: hypothetical protein D6B25_16420 [Desulfobulbaceae bacterium]